jgi:cyclic-di-GMP phosphodiesterase TipF (flagellum assembly factor)
MRRLTLALLCATYFCLALCVALTLWRNGVHLGVALSTMAGVLGLCLASHGMIMRHLQMAEMHAEVEAVREAHGILLGQVERLDGRLLEVARAVDTDLHRSAELSDDVHMLEGLVQRMSRRFEEPAPAPRLIARGGQDIPRPASLMEIVREALAENRVDLYLQPVVSLPQRRTVFYESFSRLRDASGRVIMPAEYLAVAEPAGLMAAIDNLLLFRCVQIVRRLARQDRRIGIFCNISMASLRDDEFFPSFLDLLAANRDLADALIFEVGQAAFDSRGAMEARNMGKLADLGFRFSLDKVTDLDLDLQDLSRADVKFVKLSAQTLLDELTEVDDRLVLRSLPDLAAEDFAKLTRRYGVELIVEKVESERQVVDILDLDIALGQGHLFGEPRAIKGSVLAEAGPPPSTVVEMAPRRVAVG